MIVPCAVNAWKPVWKEVTGDLRRACSWKVSSLAFGWAGDDHSLRFVVVSKGLSHFPILLSFADILVSVFPSWGLPVSLNKKTPISNANKLTYSKKSRESFAAAKHSSV
jgi:hypothetical protein